MKLLKFFFDGGEDMPPLKPSRNFIPEWYKSIKPIDRDAIPFCNQGRVEFTAKSCMPFIDAMTYGYVISLWTDVFVTNNNGYPIFNWTEGPIPILERPPTKHEDKKMPAPHGHHHEQFMWNLPIVIDTIKDCSILMTSPLNHYELPFTVLSGIVDLDTSPLFPGRVPFYIKKDFQGMIPKGTPIVQILPFKRDKWEAKNDKTLEQKLDRHRVSRNRTMIDWYKNLHWVKKVFN
jgi:hypothetical protein